MLNKVFKKVVNAIIFLLNGDPGISCLAVHQLSLKFNFNITFKMKCCIPAKSFLIAIFVYLESEVSLAQDVVGCGGYIKSSSVIDLTKIQVGLYTERGTLKDSTDCSPTSGYFFIPVYSNAKYKIKV